MNPGMLNRRVTLQKPGDIRDSAGQPGGWTDVGTVWASVLPLRGREYFAAERVDSEITVRIIVRYRADVGTNWRAVCGGQAYHIVEIINPADGREQLQLMCKRVD